ncbi:glycosyltransferase family 2 protein, partial [Geobacillus sp. MMMUD3]|nr:glycosyltransferase family 2 protein [Geobacillus sp. MMMUD3]
CVKWANNPEQLQPWFEGWRAGWRDDPWDKHETPHKLSNRGVLRMARHGRPPIV